MPLSDSERNHNDLEFAKLINLQQEGQTTNINFLLKLWPKIEEFCAQHSLILNADRQSEYKEIMDSLIVQLLSLKEVAPAALDTKLNEMLESSVQKYESVNQSAAEKSRSMHQAAPKGIWSQLNSGQPVKPTVWCEDHDIQQCLKSSMITPEEIKKAGTYILPPVDLSNPSFLKSQIETVKNNLAIDGAVKLLTPVNYRGHWRLATVEIDNKHQISAAGLWDSFGNEFLTSHPAYTRMQSALNQLQPGMVLNTAPSRAIQNNTWSCGDYVIQKVLQEVFPAAPLTPGLSKIRDTKDALGLRKALVLQLVGENKKFMKLIGPFAGIKNAPPPRKNTSSQEKSSNLSTLTTRTFDSRTASPSATKSSSVLPQSRKAPPLTDKKSSEERARSAPKASRINLAIEILEKIVGYSKYYSEKKFTNNKDNIASLANLIGSIGHAKENESAARAQIKNGYEILAKANLFPNSLEGSEKSQIMPFIHNKISLQNESLIPPGAPLTPGDIYIRNLLHNSDINAYLEKVLKKEYKKEFADMLNHVYKLCALAFATPTLLLEYAKRNKKDDASVWDYLNAELNKHIGGIEKQLASISASSQSKDVKEKGSDERATIYSNFAMITRDIYLRVMQLQEEENARLSSLNLSTQRAAELPSITTRASFSTDTTRSLEEIDFTFLDEGLEETGELDDELGREYNKTQEYHPDSEDEEAMRKLDQAYEEDEAMRKLNEEYERDPDPFNELKRGSVGASSRFFAPNNPARPRSNSVPSLSSEDNKGKKEKKPSSGGSH